MVTGGTRGIGLAIAQRLKDAGFSVVVIGRKKRHREAESDFIQVSADLSDAGDTSRLAADLAQLRPSVFIHAAGRCPQMRPDDPVEARRFLNELCDLHAGAALHLLLALAPRMSEPAQAVLISSNSVRRVTAGLAAYAASKGALEVVTRYLAELLGPRILVNAIALGLVRTSMSEHVFATPGVVESILGRTPAGRLTTAADVADFVLALVRLPNRCITGQVITLDGGNINTW